MIQFSIKKGNRKKGNKIQIHHHLYESIPYLLEFIQSHTNEEMEKKLIEALELIPFSDGTIYLLNDIGRSRKVQESDIEAILSEQINSSFNHNYMDCLAFQPFGQFILEVEEEKREYDLVADLNKEEFILFHKNKQKWSISFQEIRAKDKEELCYMLYKKHLEYPLFAVQ